MAKDVKKKTNVKKKVQKKQKEGFFKGIKKELKLVKWPTAKEILKYTLATIILCLILVAFFLCLNGIMALVKGMFN